MSLICMAGFTLYDSISGAGLPVVLLFVSVFLNLLLVLFFPGSVHLTIYLKLDDPDIWYLIVAIRIIRVLTIKEAGRFSLRTVSGFMAGHN